MTGSHLDEALSRLSSCAASSVVSRGRVASTALNAALLRRLSALPGENDALLADPIFEAALTWEWSNCSLDDLAGGLLHPELVSALDKAGAARLPRNLQPWTHQLAAWEAASEGLSFLVSAGTGSGKTECFMLPVLNDLLGDPAKGMLSGVRAIVVYPLNALIESQRERLAAWTEPMTQRFRFALYNGLTPETKRQEKSHRLGAAEIGNRRDIRENPPAILVTNVTMLEYLLLRAQDRSILEHSRGLLRWIVLDEAHGYIGAQAAEMALLLRRVRAAFDVRPEQVRLLAASATIGDGDSTENKLKRFISDLAGLGENRVRVIQGRTVEPELPETGPDTPLEPNNLIGLAPDVLWERLAPHPRIQNLKRQMSKQGVTFSDAATILFGSEDSIQKTKTQAVLDLAAQARQTETVPQLLPWRAHIFHRAQGGIWVCIDPSCKYRDPELAAGDSGWKFGAVWLNQRDRCDCDAPVFELHTCNECGTPHLIAGIEVGQFARLKPFRTIETDDFAVDAEPDADSNAELEEYGPTVSEKAVLSPARGNLKDRFLKLDDGTIFDNAPPEDARSVRFVMEEIEAERDCCLAASTSRLVPLRYSPPFFMAAAIPALLETLAPPIDQSGLPMGGRRAITFSDSRQGTARLAAKLQQDAERNLTRAFLYHSVQEDQVPGLEERTKIERQLEILRQCNDSAFSEFITEKEAILAGNVTPIKWGDLVNNFARHNELVEFATEVWRERSFGEFKLAEEPKNLAEMFLYRELFRRPKVQNNAETMGLVRLSFPTLEEKAHAKLPRVLEEAGLDTEAWTGLALAAIDLVFRARLAIKIESNQMMRLVSPRGGAPNNICKSGVAPHNRPPRSHPWPGPIPQQGRPSRLHRLIYTLIKGDPENKVDQDRAGEVLADLWHLIVSTTAKDVGSGAYQLDFKNVAVVRLNQGWLCPVTRRIFGYSPADRSPYDPDQLLKRIRLPRPPRANPGGLDAEARADMIRWYEIDAEVVKLRRDGLWTNLHDRVAAYVPFLRAQEHSAQIERPVLADYEKRFKNGRINLLNCSTTMEMGVDIQDVQIVVNLNVPPSVSNYRQRIGRAGRRGEAWAFSMTYCRDLPLDRIIFDDPMRLLSAQVTTPAVNLNSLSLVIRHVHAALLGAFLREQIDGFELKASTGAFFGATEKADELLSESCAADSFLEALRGDWGRSENLASNLADITHNTVLEDRELSYLTAETAEVFEAILRRWREEYSELLSRRDVANEPEVTKSFAIRARRMKGEFLLSELAQRGFTPSYGFPVDVVTFDHLSGHRRDNDVETMTYGERRGGASRTLDVAIREYAPRAEIVVDGLVHRSEGILPAWDAMADASRLEDLQFFWECSTCRSFGLARIAPEICVKCNSRNLRWKRSLRPAGFLSRSDPHTGYENLGHAPYEMPRLSASGSTWLTLPYPEAGRFRADPEGQVIILGSGLNGIGYALCLICGRAEPETEESENAPIPAQITKHRPLATARDMRLVGGHCPGGYTKPERIQRNVRLVHATHTDVFELQLPAGVRGDKGLALVAGLREALAERLGAEAREFGIAVGRSKGIADENRISGFLYDRASGGAGLSSRLAEAEWFVACLNRACEWLSCQEDCMHGCPACILRPDLNFRGNQLDRPGALELAQTLRDRLQIPNSMQVFGPETSVLNEPLIGWLDRRRREGRLSSVTIYMHAVPCKSELGAWSTAKLFARLKEAGVELELVLETQALTSKEMDLGQKLELHRLASHTSLAHIPELPVVGSALVLAAVRDKEETMAIATCGANEAIPGPGWGLGEVGVLVLGPAPDLPTTQTFASDRLVELSSGNARLIRVGKRLDGPVNAFGRTFWKLLANEAPLVIPAIQQYKVLAITYTDRYLLTPLSMRLLVEVIRQMPNSKAASINVLTGRYINTERQSWAVFHVFDDDAVRCDVLGAMLPGAQIDVRDKTKLPHARSFKLHLGDGRNLTILLDQGFGAWRADGAPRHDFSTDPAKQARSLKSMSFMIGVEAGCEAPIVLEE